jgi:hypothetical protein
VTANSLSSWSRVCSDKKYPRYPRAGALSHPALSSCPYSPKCLKGAFSEVHLTREGCSVCCFGKNIR